MGGTDELKYQNPLCNDLATYANQLKNAINQGSVKVSMALEYLASEGRTVSPGIFYINDVVVRDNDGKSEVIIAGVSSHRDNSNHLFELTIMGWKSTDKGNSWDKIPFQIDGSVYSYQPMDLEIYPDNKIWVSTTRNHRGSGEFNLVANTDISAFELKHTITYNDGADRARRTELEIASNGDICIAAENSYYYKSTNEFASAPVPLVLPNDDDGNVDA